MSKQFSLDAVKKHIVGDKVCPTLAEGATQLVFGDGSADAEVVFIGEAPGKNEDIQGKPFVGAAGKFLDEMLQSIGLVRSDVYITNIVKYRPPNNRDPLPEEKVAFLPYLSAQLEIIQPKVVVTLGRHSLNCFLPDLSIGVCHGKPMRVKITNHESRITNQGASGKEENKEEDTTTLVILPLYHPAAALYNGGMRQTLIDDFTKIPAIIKKIKSES